MCLNESYYVYMILNNFNIECFNDNYLFMSFYLKTYTEN